MTAGLLAQVDSAAADELREAGAPAAIFSSPLLWACGLFAAGLWLSLPRGGAGGRRVGLVLVIAAMGLFASQLPLVEGWLDQGLFSAFASTTVVSCVAAVISRNPVYSAIWFGMALLATAGLFMLTGAQFLGVATVTVYAGAILVTFLFVIMLAQPRGHAHYDRVSWEALLCAAAGSILVGLLTGAIGRATQRPVAAATAAPATAAVEREDASVHGILAENHVAHLGQELLGRHLISMQAAGALMLAALVGVVAIVAQGRRSAAVPIELASGSSYRATDDAAITLPPHEKSYASRQPAGGVHA